MSFCDTSILFFRNRTFRQIIIKIFSFLHNFHFYNQIQFSIINILYIFCNRKFYYYYYCCCYWCCCCCCCCCCRCRYRYRRYCYYYYFYCYCYCYSVSDRRLGRRATSGSGKTVSCASEIGLKCAFNSNEKLYIYLCSLRILNNFLSDKTYSLTVPSIINSFVFLTSLVNFPNSSHLDLKVFHLFKYLNIYNTYNI